MHYDFYIRNDKLMCSKLFSPYTGNVNTYVCTFNINTRFKGLQWFCVFKQDNTAIAQPILNNSCKIPAEVLTNSGTIEVGCYATNGDVNGLKRLSTNWLKFTTLTGAYIEAEAPEVPTPDVWETLVLKSIPYVGANGNWYVYSLDVDDYVDTGVKAQGETPEKGVDYWTDGDKEEVKGYVEEQTETLKSDIEGIQEQINTEAHFRGYLSTNTKIKALEATPNDFAYSAESGTKWIYDEVEGWQDTGVPVPDQLTPASDTTPLIDGTATVGTEEAYARGDHRHPTDTTRASTAEVESLKSSIENALDQIIEIQNTLIGGDSV